MRFAGQATVKVYAKEFDAIHRLNDVIINFQGKVGSGQMLGLLLKSVQTDLVEENFMPFDTAHQLTLLIMFCSVFSALARLRERT